jgi:hypothetical protein
MQLDNYLRGETYPLKEAIESAHPEKERGKRGEETQEYISKIIQLQ